MSCCTSEQLSTLRHMLGIEDPFSKRPIPYRDYAAVVQGDAKFVEMQAAGLVERYRAAATRTEYDYYRCTPAGREAAMKSHSSIRVSKSRRLYRRFLDFRDALPDVSFREFLVHGDYAEARRDV